MGFNYTILNVEKRSEKNVVQSIFIQVKVDDGTNVETESSYLNQKQISDLLFDESLLKSLCIPLFAIAEKRLEERLSRISFQKIDFSGITITAEDVQAIK